MLGAPTGGLKDALNSLVDAQLAGINPPKRESAIKSLAKSIREPYAQPPGDALFLSAIGPGINEGYFAYLRHIEQILESEISLGPTRRAVQYRRISRLQDRFVHALAQRFAMVFMSIGLPDEYEEQRDLYSETLGEGIA